MWESVNNSGDKHILPQDSTDVKNAKTYNFPECYINAFANDSNDVTQVRTLALFFLQQNPTKTTILYPVNSTYIQENIIASKLMMKYHVC